MSASESFAASRLELFDSLQTPMRPLHLEHDGKPVYALESGAGEPLLFIHGGLTQCAEWAPLMPHVDVDRRVVLVDRPGCGLTYKLDYSGLDYRAHSASFVSEVVSQLTDDPIDIVANSMGGFFALCFALAHPSRVRSLTLIGAPAGLVRSVPMSIHLMRAPVLGPAMLRSTMPPDDVRKRVYQGLLVRDASRVMQELLELGNLANALPGVAEASCTMLRNFIGAFGCRYVIRDEVAGLNIPTRFVWGSHDVFESASSGRTLAKRMPDADFVLVDDSGHVPWHDQPQGVADALNAFMADRRAAAA